MFTQINTLARSVYFLQRACEWIKKQTQPPAVLVDVKLGSEWSVQHKLGCGSHRLASPALSNHSDMARPQACCPNSTLATGKVEAEGTLAKSTSTIISPRLSTVTLTQHPFLHYFISLWLVSYSSDLFFLARLNLKDEISEQSRWLKVHNKLKWSEDLQIALITNSK